MEQPKEQGSAQSALKKAISKKQFKVFCLAPFFDPSHTKLKTQH
jgi:hypothetical protein